jgi:hypothetical protein
LYILKKILMGPRRGLEVMAKKFFPEPHGNWTPAVISNNANKCMIYLHPNF